MYMLEDVWGCRREYENEVMKYVWVCRRKYWGVGGSMDMYKAAWICRRKHG